MSHVLDPAKREPLASELNSAILGLSPNGLALTHARTHERTRASSLSFTRSLTHTNELTHTRVHVVAYTRKRA